MSKRILHYNWVDYLDPEKRGGGVSLYQRNLMSASSDEMRFLSAGISYDLLSRAPRWEQVRHGPDKDRERRFEIVNSGLLSPAHHAFGTAAHITHAATEKVFADFLEKTGPYQVIHFQNLEGLPAQALKAAKNHGAMVVFSFHNYYPICPQVNLWQRETSLCEDYADGQACEGCVTNKHPAAHLRLANALSWHLKIWGINPGSPTFDRIFGIAMRVGRRLPKRLFARAAPAAKASESAQPKTNAFADRRAQMIELINTQCDVVLCVSDAVGRIAADYGIRPDLLQTSYIGTRHAELFAKTKPRPLKTEPLSLAFLGYMRRDKGFFFLLDALETLPDDVLSRLRLVVAARRGDDRTMDRLDALRVRLGGLDHYDGYGHGDLENILYDVDVGLIPVLWHDNMPQVAIEMHARHIPLLTSDLGGAQELGNCPEMVFRAGDTQDFAKRIHMLLNEGLDAKAYWADARAPIDMQTHIEELHEIYGSSRAATNGQASQGTETAAS